MISIFLTFSDGAKFADIARNLVHGLGFDTNFSFWSGNIAQWIPPLMPYSIAAFFKIFGISDLIVISASFFFFVLTFIFVFLLARKVFKSNLVGWLSVAAVGFNYDLIHYGLSGASESPFIFEIVAAAYFVSLKKRWGTILAAIFLILMYFTRPQAIIFIFGIVIYYLFLNFSWKKATLFSTASLFFGALAYMLFSRQGISAITQNLSGIAASDSLRGSTEVIGVTGLLKKLFYNLYNFYKLLPQIINPYLFTLFVIGLFTKAAKEFKIAAVFMVAASFLVTAITIPFFRYIHPIVPLVYIISVGTLVWLVERITENKKYVVVFSSILIFIFAVGQTLGVVFLDSRYERNTHNVGKPPVYVKLSWILKENTNKDQVVVTNLDTWGSWYGERKTVWFPLEPKQLIDSSGKIPFDAIYLTSYLIDDLNYYMGESWRMIFENPENSAKWICEGCSEIAKEFKLAGVYKVNAFDDYERQDASAILLIKK